LYAYSLAHAVTLPATFLGGGWADGRVSSGYLGHANPMRKPVK